MMHYDVVVVGGGAAGLMAAAGAAGRGRRTLLLEKKSRPGIKILLSGGNRCNLTHAATPRQIVEAFGRGGPFLHSALAALGPDALVDLFEAEGVPTRVDPDGKVFPQSDRAADVLAALRRRLARTDCQVALEESLEALERAPAGLRLTTSRRTIEATSVILATGGRSYPATGSTGDGYRLAAALGHTIVPPRPALTPITSPAEWVRTLKGIALQDVVVEVVEADGPPGVSSAGEAPAATPCLPGGRTLARRRGALLFAHFGVSGPAVLDVSREVSGHPETGRLRLRCDLVPALDAEQLQAAIRQKCAALGRRLAAALLTEWFPQRLAETVLAAADCRLEWRAAELPAARRRAIVATVKGFEIPVDGTMGFRKAEVTAGGVALDEVDSRSMQSKLVGGLYFAGEILDLDGPIGGYNFQAAFSTGWLAGERA